MLARRSSPKICSKNLSGMRCRRSISYTPKGSEQSSIASSVSARTAYLLFCVSLRPDTLKPPARQANLRLNCSRYLRVGGPDFGLVVVLVEVAVAVLAHGALYALAGDEKDGARPDIHAVVGDAFEVVHGEGGTNAPLGGTYFPLVRVHREVHRLRVEKVNLIVGGLQVAGAFYIAVLEDVEALPEKVAGAARHLQEGGLDVGVAVGVGGLGDRTADVFAQGTGAHQVVRHRLHRVDEPQVPGHRGLAGLQDQALLVDLRPPLLKPGVHADLAGGHLGVVGL